METILSCKSKIINSLDQICTVLSEKQNELTELHLEIKKLHDEIDEKKEKMADFNNFSLIRSLSKQLTDKDKIIEVLQRKIELTTGEKLDFTNKKLSELEVNKMLAKTRLQDNNTVGHFDKKKLQDYIINSEKEEDHIIYSNDDEQNNNDKQENSVNEKDEKQEPIEEKEVLELEAEPDSVHESENNDKNIKHIKEEIKHIKEEIKHVEEEVESKKVNKESQKVKEKYEVKEDSSSDVEESVVNPDVNMEDMKIVKVLGKRYFMHKTNKKLYKKKGDNCGKLIGKRRKNLETGTFFIEYKGDKK